MRNTVRPVPREALAHPEGIVVRRIAAALTCVSVALLSACSTPEPSPVPTPETSVGSTTDASEATATSTPDDAVQTTSPGDVGADPGVPEMPTGALEDTVEGAEAFVQYYIDLVNYTGKHPKAGILEPYGSPECGTCDVFEEEVATLEESGGYYDADTVSSSDLQTTRFDGDSQVRVFGETPSMNERDASGGVVRSLAADKELEWLVQIKPTDNGFLVVGIVNAE
jgi:hypothetical protein